MRGGSAPESSAAKEGIRGTVKMKEGEGGSVFVADSGEDEFLFLEVQCES